MDQNAAPLKSVLLRAWRERWSDMKWSIHVKRLITQPGGGADDTQLADLLLQQALVGSSPNNLVLSYLRHAISTQMISYGTAIKSVIRYRDIGKLFCTKGLLELVEEMISRLSWRGTTEDSVALSRASVHLALWLVESLQHCLQKITDNKMTGDYSTIADKICDCLNVLSSDKAAAALVYIGQLEESDTAKQVEQLAISLQPTLAQCSQASVDLRKKVDSCLKVTQKFGSQPLQCTPLIEVHHHPLNISINALLNVEVVLNPTNETAPFIEQLLVIERLQGLSRSELYCEVLRSCLMGLIDAASGPDEFKWVAFTFLKLPQALGKLVQQGTELETSQHLEEGINALLDYGPLIDLADTKGHCDCLQFLLQELRNHSLVTDLQCKRFMAKRQMEGQRKPPEVAGQQPSASLILRAVPTVSSILKTLDADYSKNQDGLLGVLCHMMSGKSFELILAAAAAMGKLQSFATKLIKFNEFAKQSNGEAGKAAQTRALLFDISFLMLCHITQLYGTEIILSKSDNNSSFFAQWALKCLPEDGKYKSPDLLAPADPNKVEVLLSQFSPGGDLKTNLTRWNEVCHNAPYTIQEVLFAWEHRAISQEDVKAVMDNVKGLMCCLPVIVAAWLCSYINLVDHDTRKKPRLMLQQLCTGTHTPDPANQFYNERSNLMQIILNKMIQDVLPIGSQRRNAPYVLPPTVPAKSVLLETFRGMFKKGCADILSVYKMDLLLSVGGPRWFCEHLVGEVLNHDRPEDLTKGIGLLYSIFHIDLENLALLLFHHSLPAILQADDSKLSLLTDPRGRYLAKLCIMSLVAVHKMKHSDRTETSPCRRGRKRTRADIELEEEEDLIEEESPPTKVQKLPGSDGESSGAGDTFNMGGILASRDDEFVPNCDLKEPLNKALANLFRLFCAILNHDQASQRTGFIMSFIDETIKSGSTTARFCLQFMPPSMVVQLMKMFPQDFNPQVLMAMFDMDTVVGRRVASKVISQHAKYRKSAEANRTWI